MTLYIDKPGEGEVTVKVAACAICHSDVHSAQGEHMPIKLPAIGGHEIAGHVSELGPGCSYVKEGDPVIVSIVTPGCGQCYFCLIGQPYNCANKPLKPDELVSKHYPFEKINEAIEDSRRGSALRNVLLF